MAPETDDPDLAMRIYYHTGRAQFRHQDYDAAAPYMEKAFRLCEGKNITSWDQVAFLIQDLTAIYFRTGKIKKAEAVADKGLQILQKAPSLDIVMTWLYKDLAENFQKAGNLTRAIDAYEKISEYGVKGKWFTLDNIIENDLEIAGLYYSQKNLPQTMKYMKKAEQDLSIYFHLPNDSNEYFNLYYDIGNRYQDFKLWNEAWAAYEKADQINCQETIDVIWRLISTANRYEENQKSAEAMVFYWKFLVELRKASPHFSRKYLPSIFNSGDKFKAAGKSAESAECYADARAVFRRYANDSDTISIYLKQANQLYKQE